MTVIKKSIFLSEVIFKWISTLLIGCLREKTLPVHVLFCIVDHFEPGTGHAGLDIEKNRMEELLSKYPKLADKHHDFYGNHPKRTWFFPPHYHRNGNLQRLVSLCEKGYGEIELHLHHGKTRPDTSENLEKTIVECVKEYARFGIFGAENGERRYGFIHGDWALNNSLGGKYCGVNDEIQILKRTGCYADFTLPSPEPEVNPRQINSVYYASTDSIGPKSYDRGRPVTVHGNRDEGLMIIQGPLFPFFPSNGMRGIRFTADQISRFYPISTKRIDRWVKTGIHVKGKDNWVIVKIHMHGAVDGHVVLGEEMNRIFSYLESKYNDGNRFILHYVTSRELYNIIKAVEAGETGGTPEDYRDNRVKPPTYRSANGAAEASDVLRDLVAASL